MHPGWPHGPREAELGSLYDWIDSRMAHHHNGREWGIWGGVTGSLFGLAGGTIGVLVGAMHLPPSTYPWAIGGPLVTAAALSMLGAVIIHKRQTPGQRAIKQAMADARTFTWQLWGARWQGNLKVTLGEDRAFALNEGAASYLRARQALNSSSWKAVAPDTEWAATRERTTVAMEVAMARLVTTIGQGVAANSVEIRNLLGTMNEAADETVRTSERLAMDTGEPGNASENLRQVLAEMRLLNSASEEYDRLRDRSH